ncbi:hypothetical protein [Methylobacterium organophilum]|nr:hypothetical protein [Methylobacterium organophilum]
MPALLDSPAVQAQQVTAPFANELCGGEADVSLSEISVSAETV